MIIIVGRVFSSPLPWAVSSTFYESFGPLFENNIFVRIVTDKFTDWTEPET